MPARGDSLVVTYMAWDFVTQTGRTGDSTNHILKLLLDGREISPSNNPTEIDSAGLPGMYNLTVTPAETQCAILIVCGMSSSTGVSIIQTSISLT